jgi:hypothetical protein
MISNSGPLSVCGAASLSHRCDHPVSVDADVISLDGKYNNESRFLRARWPYTHGK